MGNKETLLKFMSEQGYKRNSPDKNRPFNIIPSNNITMKGVDFPVLGMSNTGHIQKMYPGMDYEFDGDVVFEIPMKQQFGGDMKFWRPVLQTGGVKPLYVNDANDPRYRAYQDSLSLYNKYKKINDQFNDFANKTNSKHSVKYANTYIGLENPNIAPIGTNGFISRVGSDNIVTTGNNEHSKEFSKKAKDYQNLLSNGQYVGRIPIYIKNQHNLLK